MLAFGFSIMGTKLLNFIEYWAELIQIMLKIRLCKCLKTITSRSITTLS